MAISVKTILLAAREIDVLSSSDDLRLVAATNRTESDTIKLISSLVLAESKIIRTSTIILASFNILAAFITAASILYDGYRAAKRYNPNLKISKFSTSWIHPADICPLVLSIGIMIQGLIFAGVQGRGLEALKTKGCATVAQLLWPAIFIVPYIQLVFGLECVIRSFRSLPFQDRGKHDIKICCGVIILMLVVTWIPSQTLPESDICYASLLWYIPRHGKLGFIILSSTAGLMVICILNIFCRLSTVSLIDRHQRIVASRIVHYMMVGVVSLALILPFFLTLFNDGRSKKFSLMATVVLNISGLMTGLLHLILRSNTSTTSFGPKIGGSWDRSKHEIRIFGPNELAMYNPLFDPVFGPSNATLEHSGNWEQSSKEETFKNYQDLKKLPSYTNTNQESEKTEYIYPARKKSSPVQYSLFPNQDVLSHGGQLPLSVYDITDLAPPRPIFARKSRHIRNSSDSSSVTVQIGLRLSHAPMEDQVTSGSFFLPATTYGTNIVTSPLSPRASVLLSPIQILQPAIFSGFSRDKPSPILIKPESTSRNASFSISTPLRSSPLSSRIPRDNPPLNNQQIPTSNSVLSLEKIRASGIKLSSSVYKPEKKISSPRKVLSPNVASMNPLENHRKLSSNSQTALNYPVGKSDWI
ncbi:hypothetical protein GcC1_003031 [Golovinomyces cichoracearum]|uniref:Uncharacterized protein n=1 Tax=Golovinomyces cichoracearum TaxID=62708 RepID=A0A420J9J2_9PEZI|nr:hypothetical protein GcC1_003031 [Golovinomyces cichoracearum]